MYSFTHSGTSEQNIYTNLDPKTHDVFRKSLSEDFIFLR